MFNKLGSNWHDKTMDNLCTHLVKLGIDAELVETGALEDIGTTPLFASLVRLGLQALGTVSDLGSIKVQGQNIDVVQVTRYVNLDRYSGTGGPVYEVDYAVKGSIKGTEASVTAQTKVTRKGFFRIRAIDLEWTGGELAELLNTDQSLKECMLHTQMLNKYDIEIKPDRKRLYVRIHQGHGAFPSKHIFECYNTIAKHLRPLLQ